MGWSLIPALLPHPREVLGAFGQSCLRARLLSKLYRRGSHQPPSAEPGGGWF